MKKNYFYNILLTVINLLIPIIIFPYVARILGAEGVGKVQFVMTLCQYLALLAALGIPIYGIREIAKVKHSPRQLAQTIKELLLINGITASTLFITYEIVVLTVPFFSADRYYYLIAGTVILSGFTSVEWLFSGLEQFKQIAFRAIIIKTISLLFIFLLVKNREDTLPFLISSIFAIMANNVLNIWFVFKMTRIRTGRVKSRKHLRPLLFLSGTMIASTLYTYFDSVILGFISGNRSVGLYTAATRLSKVLIPFLLAYGGVLLPQITRSVQDQDHDALEIYLNKSLANVVMLAAPMCAGLFTFAPTLMRLFCGVEFDDAIWAMRMMSGLPFLIGLGYFWGYQVIVPMGKDSLLLRSAIIGMVLSLSLNVLLVPKMGQNGAAISNVIAEVVVTICYYVLIRGVVTVHIRVAFIWEALLSTAPFFLFYWLQQGYFRNDQLGFAIMAAFICSSLYILLQIFLFKNKYLLAILKVNPFNAIRSR